MIILNAFLSFILTSKGQSAVNLRFFFLSVIFFKLIFAYILSLCFEFSVFWCFSILFGFKEGLVASHTVTWKSSLTAFGNSFKTNSESGVSIHRFYLVFEPPCVHRALKGRALATYNFCREPVLTCFRFIFVSFIFLGFLSLCAAHARLDNHQSRGSGGRRGEGG